MSIYVAYCEVCAWRQEYPDPGMIPDGCPVCGEPDLSWYEEE